MQYEVGSASAPHTVRKVRRAAAVEKQTTTFVRFSRKVRFPKLRFENVMANFT